MKFYSNGKLLITGEYVVLDGAKALAIPTAYGQSLEVVSTNTNTIDWISKDEDGSIWFESQLTIEKLAESFSNVSDSITKRIFDLLICAKQLNPDFLKEEKGLKIKTKLEFNRNWGLGSSSTLINNIAQWATIDAYELLERTFGGSGYDIACAKHDRPITFQRINSKPHAEEVSFNPSFNEHLYFIYLNKKQRSDVAVKNYRDIAIEKRTACLHPITHLTNSILHCDSIALFNELIIEHENIIGDLLGETPIQQKLFNDFNGAVKSLGAWGGDFVLVSCEANPEDYFNDKGYQTIIPFSEMIKK